MKKTAVQGGHPLKRFKNNISPIIPHRREVGKEENMNALLQVQKNLIDTGRTKGVIDVKELNATIAQISELEARISALQHENTLLSLSGSESVQFYKNWRSYQ